MALVKLMWLKFGFIKVHKTVAIRLAACHQNGAEYFTLSTVWNICNLRAKNKKHIYNNKIACIYALAGF